jgi:pyocin large subunit-like protein
MSMFSGIMEKLGFNKKAQQAGAAPTARGSAPSPAPTPSATGSAPQPTVRQAPAAMPMVDVMGQLEKLAAANPQTLNWRTSIVDMLKLLGMDSSITARKNLATELGCPPDKLGDSAQMNVWLHKAVLEKLAQNGGNVPQDLLH